MTATEGTLDHPTSNAAATLDPEARRLLWRCRRGMKELDGLLERFARRELPGYGPQQRQALAHLLELPDPELVDYLLGQVIPPEPGLAELVLRIRTSPVRSPGAGDPSASRADPAAG